MYQLQLVTDPHLEKLFLQLPQDIYQHDPHWVAPITKDIQQIFDPKTNKLLKTSKLKRWILWHKDRVVGRIAAFYNPRYRNLGDGEKKVGGIGFFECIDNQKAANLLLQAAQEFLTDEGCEIMDGPINLGERDRFWGMLVEGFTRPLYAMNYNPSYYQKLFENYGFRPFYYQLCFGIENAQNWEQTQLLNVYKHISQDKNYSIRTLTKHNILQSAHDFVHIYNAAWAKHQGNKQLNFHAVYMMLKKMRFIIEPGLSYFTYYKGEPVGMIINIPDLNFYFKDFSGKLGIWQKLQFLWKKTMLKPDKMVGIVFGIHPKVQNRGVDALMIINLQKYVQSKTKYKYYEMQWIGDFNQKMVKVAEKIAPKITRKFATYRYLFDKNAQFSRHPIF